MFSKSKKKVAYSFEILINLYRETRRHIPKDCNIHRKRDSQLRAECILLRAFTLVKHPYHNYISSGYRKFPRI
jgi:hypothetical protein